MLPLSLADPPRSGLTPQFLCTLGRWSNALALNICEPLVLLSLSA